MNTTLSRAHELLGHCSMEEARKTAKHLNWSIVKGSEEVCKACAAGKAKQKNLPRHDTDEGKSTAVSGRVYLDIATIKNKEGMPKILLKNWRIMVDEKTGLKFSDFYKKKSDMVKPTCEKLHKLKEKGNPVKIIRLDSAGENKLLMKQADSKDWKLNIEFEFTARGTPQQNSLAEVLFKTIMNKGRALMNAANLLEKMRYKLFMDAIKTATLLNGMMVVELEGEVKTRFEHYLGKLPNSTKYLRTWGEAGTVKIKTDTSPKLNDKGVQCMFVGYDLNHPGDCYIMYNPKTDRRLISRDVIWLRRMYYQNEEPDEMITGSPKVAVITNVNPEAGEDGDDISIQDEQDEEVVEEEKPPPLIEKENKEEQDVNKNENVTQSRSGRMIKAPIRLIKEIDHLISDLALTSVENKYVRELETIAKEHPEEVACVGVGIGGGLAHTNELKPMKFDEAMSGTDADKWQIAVEEEKEKMDKNIAFEETTRSSIPEGAKVLTSTWTMKKKANGKYRARLNARGYEQKDGEHYDEHDKFAPVMNEITGNIAMVLSLMAGWAIKVLDVKGAFLHGKFEKGRTLYMEVPQGFKNYYKNNSVLKLNKTLYGTIQAAKRFWIELLKVFHELKYKKSDADPCLYFKWTLAGLIIWFTWVDDCVTCGNKEAVDLELDKMKAIFDCKDLGEMKEYIGCKVDRNDEKCSIKVTQPVLMQSFQDEFDVKEGNEALYTPAPPGEVLPKCMDDEAVSPEEQTRYRSGVGKLLHEEVET
uniref:Integrase catalytic domain-containing protein n=1 Tax=Leptocylindrus danicus TaxID=163516 RepID=A0A7S2KWV0_9STRA|mmetsp:Transcript_28279/g.41616  ORF Transcript_28279/g.41616 Transcript_28279/m.41616 type:complete len:756 (+) Transcript_28279:556-2823(+)